MDHHDRDADEELAIVLLWISSDGRGWPTLIITLVGLTLLLYHYFG